MDHPFMGCDDMEKGWQNQTDSGPHQAHESAGGPDSRGTCKAPFNLPDCGTLDPRGEDTQCSGGFSDGIEIKVIELTAGDLVAADWLIKWKKYCHDIDDLIDELFSPEHLLNVLAQAVELYSHSFFLAHVNHLRPIVISVTNAYADSVRWERSGKLDEQRMADVLRFAGVEMYCMVAAICGGYAHMRKYSPQIRKHTWANNHDQTGNPH